MYGKTDLRIVKTKKAINDAFLQLIEEKGFANITITDIAERAVINRKTFYKHYETKEQLYDEIADKFINILNSSNLVESLLKDDRTEQHKLLINALIYIKKHRDIFNILINDQTTTRFSNRLRDTLVNNMCNKSNMSKKISDSHFTVGLLCDLFCELFRIIVQWWVNTDNISPEYVMDMMLEFFSPKPLDMLGLSFE